MALSGSVDVTFAGGFDFDAATQTVQAEARSALQAGAEVIRSISVPQTPILTGVLRASATTSVSDQELKAAVSYDTYYAQDQHENLSYNHREGNAKYLENALAEGAEDAVDVIAAQLRRAFR